MRWKQEEIKKREKLLQEKDTERYREENERLITFQICQSFLDKLCHANNKLPSILRLRDNNTGYYRYLGTLRLCLSYERGAGPVQIMSDGSENGNFIISYDITCREIYMITHKEEWHLFSSTPNVSRFYWIDESHIDILLRNLCTGRMIDEGFYPFKKRRGAFRNLENE